MRTGRGVGFGLLCVALFAASSTAHAERTLVCARTDDCPESVAWLVRTTPADALSCTAFLVADDTLITARHCALPRRTDGGRVLPGELTLIFAATGEYPAERHRARILRLSDAADVSVQSASDWAVVRLETHTTRRAMRIERIGAEDHLAVAVHAVDADAGVDAERAVLQTLRCSVVHASLFAPHLDGPLTPALLLAGCAIRGGHSGAPVVDALGRVRALVHARDARRWPWRDPLQGPPPIAGAEQTEPLPIAYATSLACIDWGRSGRRPASCDRVAWEQRTGQPGEAALQRATAVRQELDALVERLRSEAVRIAAARDPREEWLVVLERDRTRVDVLASPRCLIRREGELPVRTRVRIVVADTGRPETHVDALPGLPMPLCAEPGATRTPLR